MKTINQKRLLLGTLAGGVVWALWSWVVNGVFLAQAYSQAQAAGALLSQPRYPFFMPVWFLTLFLVTFVLAWWYTGMREVFAPGPKTALAVGILGGFITAFPLNFSAASWAPVARLIPLGWLLDLWVGAVLATLVAAWLYREP